MKFCKDCAHYREPAGGYKCFVDARCMAGELQFDPVTGREMRYAGEPWDLRNDPGKCGLEAKWFVPANLDGRLAMLEEVENGNGGATT